MAEWSKNRADSSSINSGREFTTDDDLAVNELNAMVNNSFYAVDFAEAMADAPDISEIDGTGTPSVSIVDNGKFKKLKFSNLKGEKGEQGIRGEKGDSGGSTTIKIDKTLKSASKTISTSNTETVGEYNKTNFPYYCTTSINLFYGLSEDVLQSLLNQLESGKSCIAKITTSTGTERFCTVNYFYDKSSQFVDMHFKMAGGTLSVQSKNIHINIYSHATNSLYSGGELYCGESNSSKTVYYLDSLIFIG